MIALDALILAATRSSEADSFYSCGECGGSMRGTVLGGLGPLACASCDEIRWSK